jgi:predicted MFS family arabinose efflux permease
MQIGRRDAPAAGGLLNTGGNLGGIIATPAVAYLSSHGGWNLPFEVGAACAALSGLAWLFIDPATPARSPEARSC